MEPLAQAFGRLDIQMLLFTNSSVHMNTGFDNSAMAGLPPDIHLRHIGEAGRLHSLQIAAMRELVHDVESERFSPEGITPSTYAKLQGKLFRQLVSLERWHGAMQDLLPRLTGEQDERTAKLLLMAHITCKMMVTNVLTDGREVYWDRYLPEFEELLQLAADWVATRPQRSRGGEETKQPGFSMDMGIVASTYYAAMKCRDPEMRRRAIALMRQSKQQEAAWDPETMANLATSIMNVEEGWRDGLQSAEEVPEHRRLYRASFDLKRGPDTMFCVRRAFESDGSWLRYEISVSAACEAERRHHNIQSR